MADSRTTYNEFDFRRNDGRKMTIKEYLNSEHAAPSDENEVRFFSIANTANGTTDDWMVTAPDFLAALDKRWHGSCPKAIEDTIYAADGCSVRVRVTTVHMFIPCIY